MKSSIVDKVQEQARKIAKRETQRFPHAASPGDAVRQGDVYITLLERVPTGYARQRKWDRQLAPGATQGSRHVIDPRWRRPLCASGRYEPTVGPPFKRGTEITHPEHVAGPSAWCYGIVPAAPRTLWTTAAAGLTADDGQRRTSVTRSPGQDLGGKVRRAAGETNIEQTQ